MTKPKQTKSAKQISFAVVASDEGSRLDSVIAAHQAEISRSAAKRLIERGKVKLLRKRRLTEVAPSLKTSPGDVVKIDLSKPKTGVKPKILAKTAHYLIVNKPAGLLTHPKSPALDDEWTLIDALKSYIAKDTPRDGIVHRLDRGTSGVMVVARTKEAHSRISQQFAKRLVDKRYLAIVGGKLASVPKLIDAAIARDPSHKASFMVSKAGKSAMTKLLRSSAGKRYSLVEVQPLTGRTHQIRVHLSRLGHPIVGDKVYGAKSKESYSPRIFLHAYSLGFNYNQRHFYVAPLPKDMRDLAESEAIDVTDFSHASGATG